MALLISFFLLSILFSFMCSIWEAVLLSVTPAFIARNNAEGSSSGELLSRLKKDIDKPLSAILTLNTIAHTVGAIGVGAQAGAIFGAREIGLWGITLSYESIIAAGMTLAILIISEIIPKTIGANNWQTLAPFTARSVHILIMLLKPFVYISKLITNMLNKGEKKSVFSRRDFAAMADVVGETGAIKKADHTLIKNILAFDELVAENVMTPRTVIAMANENLTLRDFYATDSFKQFSRFPLFSESKDNVTGMLLKDELLMKLVEGKGDLSLREIKRPIKMVSEKDSLRTIFGILNESRAHLVIVSDEYGGTQGLVSMEDIFETLFGLEIIDETDSIQDLQQYARKKWEERAKKLGMIN